MMQTKKDHKRSERRKYADRLFLNRKKQERHNRTSASTKTERGYN